MKLYFTSFLLLFVFVLYAQPGTVDKTYGVNNTGTVSVSTQLYAISSAMQPDNKIVIGGSGSSVGEFFISLYNKDGGVDTSFGNKGKTITQINDLTNFILFTEGWADIALQEDGKIVATGNVLGSDYDLVVARFLPDGMTDESFGNHGRIITDLGYLEIAKSIAVQADNKILVSGYQNKDISGNGTSSLLVRYNTDGTLDENFGENKGYWATTCSRARIT